MDASRFLAALRGADLWSCLGCRQGAGGIAGPASAGFNGLLLRGYAAYPTPDDSDGPGDPRASDGGGSRLLGQGFMASPPDGGQGGQPIPPGPLFMRLRMRRAR